MAWKDRGKKIYRFIGEKDFLEGEETPKDNMIFIKDAEFSYLWNGSGDNHKGKTRYFKG